MVVVLDVRWKVVIIYDSAHAWKHISKAYRAVLKFGHVFGPWIGGDENGDGIRNWEVRTPEVVQQGDRVSCGIFALLTLLVVVQDMGAEVEELYPAGAEVDVARLRERHGRILERMMIG